MWLELDRYFPPQQLIPYVRFFYFIRTGADGASHWLDNHPQGSFDVLFILRGEVHTESKGLLSPPLRKLVLIPQQEQRFRVTFGANARMGGIVFKPGWFNKLFQIPLDGLANSGHALEAIYDKSVLETLERMAEAHDQASQLRLLQDFVTQALVKMDESRDNISEIIGFIQQQEGLVRMDELADHASMSLRSLQRKLKDRLGVTPKRYTQVVRFNALLSQLKKQPVEDWQELIFQYQYYDQSHLIKDFKRYTGHSPQDFIEKDQPLSDFFQGF